MKVVWALVVSALVTLAAQAQEPREAVLAVLRGYHDALAARQPEKVTALLGPSYMMADASAGGVSPHLFLTGDRLRSWPENYLAQVAPHKNAFEPLSVSVRGDAAVAITRDTGSNRFRAWSNEETTWFLGRVNGEWRLVAMIIRDIQLPK